MNAIESTPYALAAAAVGLAAYIFRQYVAQQRFFQTTMIRLVEDNTRAYSELRRVIEERVPVSARPIIEQIRRGKR